GILEYSMLTKEVIFSLVDKQIKLLNSRLESKEIFVKISDDIKALIAERGYDDRYGARPLASVFNKMIIRPLSVALLRDKLDKGTLVIDKMTESGEISIKKQ